MSALGGNWAGLGVVGIAEALEYYCIGDVFR